MVSNIDHKAVKALIHGQECANSLKTLLDNRETSSVLLEPLINTILDSFSVALSYVDSINTPPHHESSSQHMAGFVPRKSSKKKICGIKGIENYRDDCPTPPYNDGFTWRKYGQKTIKTSPHKRCYYRCTDAKDKNCKATKRVRKIKDNPSVYRTTYVGKHICNAFADNDDTYGSEMIQFDRVMPQLTTIDHQAAIMEDKDTDHIMNQAATMEDKDTDHIMNQECDINDYLVDDDHLWANKFPSFSSEDFKFLDNVVAFD